MPFLLGREVESYRVTVFSGSTLVYDRQILLTLKATSSAPAHTVDLQFMVVPPTDFVSIGTTFSTLQLARSNFDAMLSILQTESPIFLNAYETDSGTIVRYAGLGTNPEFTGEGLRDSNTAAT